MSLASGTRLGPYEVVAPLGEGGMGEVYKATDTRLKRTVAIKILPRDFAADPERRQRFEREARVVASLSHPHICALHDVGIGDVASGESMSYLVMEYLEGETLAERLRRGPLPLDETLRAGAAIAAALAAAHREGIVHRDLKPANVMLTRSGVKLLDFGIAKAVQPSGASTDALSTKALTVATAAGTTLGTIHYMSPEQLEGHPVDARSDIFALGAVLYEMGTGRRAFAGDSYAAIASNILGGQPPPIQASAALDRLVRGCLEKDPDRRWQSAQDVARQLSTPDERDGAVDVRVRRRGAQWLPWAIAAMAGAIAVAAWVVDRSPGAATAATGPQIITFPIAPPSSGPYGFTSTVEAPAMAVSPDGSRVAFVTITRAAETRIWIRALDSLDAKAVDGTDGATSVFWSPDSKSIAFFAGGQLKRVELGGGAPLVICSARQTIGQTGTWSADGTILFASVQGEAILKVADSGGTPVALITLDAQRKEKRVAWPAFLPDGRQFTFLKVLDDDSARIMLAAPGSPQKEILEARSNAQYVDPGYVLYVQDASLIARRFDASTGQISGPPIAVADPVAYFHPTGLGHFSASRNGVIAYQSHANLARIAWFDRAGNERGTVRPSGGYLSLKLSPDGKQLLYDRANPRTGAHDLYLLEMDRGAEIQLTNEPGSEVYPHWGLGDTILYARTRGNAPRLFRRSLASALDEPVGPERTRQLQQPTDVSRDGRWLLYSQRSARGDYDIHALHLPDMKEIVLRESVSNEVDGRFSPDGKHVAYASNEGGRPNVYVMPFAAGGSRRAVSTDGGTTPRWAPDGRQLYFVSAASDEAYVSSVPIAAGAVLGIGQPSRLFPLAPGRRWGDFIPTSDGRFLAVQHLQFAGAQPLTIIVNWSPRR